MSPDKTRVVVVTGGGAGIGAAIAEEVGRAGAFVVTVDPGLTLAVNFALFLGVLLVKPAGLFGRAQR